MFNVGQELTIEIFKDNLWQNYRSKIMDIDSDTIAFSYPVHVDTNRKLFLANGEQVKVSIVQEDGQAYEFISFISGRKNEKMPLLMMFKPKENDIVKIQRRQFVRINWAVDVAVHPVRGEFTPFTTVTSDISAGGASIIVNKQIELKKGQEIFCWIVLPRNNGEYNYLKFNCKIVRIQELNSTKNTVSVQFLNKSSQEEQTLIRFCYEAQVAMKQKELGVF